MIYDEVNKMIEYLKRKKECALQQADMGIKSGDLSYRNYQQGKGRAYSDAIDQAIAVLNKVPCERGLVCDHENIHWNNDAGVFVCDDCNAVKR